MADENSVGNRMPSDEALDTATAANSRKRPPIPSFSTLGCFSSGDSAASSRNLVSAENDDGVAVESALTQIGESIPRGSDENDHNFVGRNEMEIGEIYDEGAMSSEGSFSSDDSVSSDDNDDDEAEEETAPLSLQERMIRNQQRNALFLEALNEKYHGQIPNQLQQSKPTRRKRRQIKSNEGDNDAGEETPPFFGMLRPKPPADGSITGTQNVTVSLGQRLNFLVKKYPYREGQVRRLTALLHGNLGACRGLMRNRGTASGAATNMHDATVHVPGPIFLTGPRGCGKTSIAKDVLQMLQAENTTLNGGTTSRPTLRSAYINCVTLEPSSMERLVADAYKQLKPTTDYSSRCRERRARQRRHVTSIVPHSSTSQSTAGKSPKNSSETGNVMISTNKISVGGDFMAENQTRLQPRRAAKVVVPSSSATSKKRKANSSKVTAARDEPMDDVVETSHSTMAAFGRSLHRFFGAGSQRAAVLVIDNAERLLTLSARKAAHEKTNCLAELLLLPKVMRLNLTIVLISRYSLLYGTRLDNIASPEKSAATLAGSVGGLTIQFPAYKDHQVMQNVLKSDNVLPLIIDNRHCKDGMKGKNAFMEKVVDGFLGALVQFLSDSTNDLNEFVRVGRSLWPIYIKPLHPSAIKDTLATLGVKDKVTGDEKLDRDVLGLLGRQFFNVIGKVSTDLTLLPIDSPLSASGGKLPVIPKNASTISGLQLPFLRICLLLAAFICQNNRAENDKKVFSVHGNGKRRKTRKGGEGKDNDETFAFASTAGGADQLKSLRPRPFLVERVFSIFVTLVRLNPDLAPQLPGNKRIEYTAESIGTSRLYEDLRYLIDLGYIHTMPFSGGVRGEQINFNAARFWCSLTENEATQLANSVGIPLDSYLV